jgi:hypothetical protein
VRFEDRIDSELRGGLAFYEMLGLAQHRKLEGDTVTALRRRGTEMLAAALVALPHDERVRTEDRTIDRAGSRGAHPALPPGRRGWPRCRHWSGCTTAG